MLSESQKNHRHARSDDIPSPTFSQKTENDGYISKTIARRLKQGESGDLIELFKSGK